MPRRDEESWDSERSIREGDALLRIEDLTWASPRDFTSDNLVILVHGFTADGGYLRTLGQYLEEYGFHVLLYNYNSYRGIDSIAETLERMLFEFESSSPGSIERNGFFLVAHSLGGLIARRLALYDWLAALIRGIVMLGTPNDGCFQDEQILDYIIQYGQYLSDFMPVTNAASKTAKELIKKDSSRAFLLPKPGLIDRLNERWKKDPNLPPSITISGGRPKLVLSRNPALNWVVNQRIQRIMRGERNDGLIQERSVDLNLLIYGRRNTKHTHLNSYPEYPNINHSGLKDNLTIALKIVSWLRSR